ncbi:hypothetical protein DL546_005147 [Coniochaeta pulveracea]|uniref:Mtf2-like C-terminal domain-containing protein n=1 Tax=Coniochaeta pulveracea TaxID=177199 RepID=A0A420Y1L1_9PEZI|nr:hypothetical protein DL546_005147 [Coniochaeta pulveracea]
MSNTLTPFLYQTRTLRRVQSSLAARRALLRAFSNTSTRPRRPRPADDAIPFELPSDVQHDVTLHGGSESQTPSTITPTERKAFDAIFQEIATRGARSSRSQAADQVINLVVQDAIGESYKPPSRQTDVMDRDAALEKFPPSLRKAASMALGAMEDPDNIQQYAEADVKDLAKLSREEAAARKLGQEDVLDWEDDTTAIDQLVKTATIGEHRRREQHRVEQELSSAESDFDLWKSITKDVFSMVDRLGISEKTTPKTDPAPANAEHVSKRNKKDLNVYVHGPLYPLLLLRGLRLLDKAFEKPSALALSVLPRVKELGLASHVLGASMPFYNTLMGIYWYRYGDVGAVFNLLEEMRRAGLSFDEDSLEIIRDIDRTLVPFAEGESGQFVKELTSMPEYEPAFDSRLPHWENIIQGSIEDRNSKRPAIY